MGDPLEGVAADGTIVTGADRSRISPAWRTVLDDVVASVAELAPAAAVHLFGSVATGQAVEARSDVDLLTIGLAPADAAEIAGHLSTTYADVCRGVEIGTAAATDFVGDGDEQYGNRVFLRHYCVHLAGPVSHVPTHDFAADRRAARGFNGDVGRHLDRWRAALDTELDPPTLARRVARKSLLAVAGLVSIHDRTWTTDRARAATRWSEVRPELAGGLERLDGWVDGAPGATVVDVRDVLDSTVRPIVAEFESSIGAWVEPADG